jgi:dihydropteroate synthase
MSPTEFDQWLLDPRRRVLVMAVLNVTPDSFSDGGRFASPSAAAEQARAMIDQGADLIDVGGESTRPGAQRVMPAEQIARVVPAINAIRRVSDITISIDTTSSSVAEAALQAGANIVNDISAGREDPRIFPLVAQRRVPIILMHMQGSPATMQQNPSYDDVVQDVTNFLRTRLAAATAAGIDSQRMLVDPGIGFGKTLEHNLALLRRQHELLTLSRPVVIGTSRKGFIGKITGEPDPQRRSYGTAASVAWSVAHGAAMVRVHDVGPMVQVVRMIRSIMEADGASR